MYQNVLFYEFTPINNPELFRDEHRIITKALNLLGKILVSEEGINGNVSGTKHETKQYMELLRKRFSDIEFKIGNTKTHTFNKMVVKYRPEIITLEEEVDMSQRGEYVTPKELKELLDNNEDVVLLDGRNKYEADFGTFNKAIIPDINTFKEFPRFIQENLSELKDKQIVTFCTGGIRCEKLTAYMKQQGFENVKQLQGGILTYGEEIGGEHWRGECFVFDERLAVDMNNIEAVHENRENTACANPAYFKYKLQES
ncbi:MAG: rhodanese-related sulfurtransferase [Candidatus Woesearchaeota archaeon]